jgi:hypothetical protein
MFFLVKGNLEQNFFLNTRSEWLRLHTIEERMKMTSQEMDMATCFSKQKLTKI